MDGEDLFEVLRDVRQRHHTIQSIIGNSRRGESAERDLLIELGEYLDDWSMRLVVARPDLAFLQFDNSREQRAAA